MKTEVQQQPAKPVVMKEAAEKPKVEEQPKTKPAKGLAQSLSISTLFPNKVTKAFGYLRGNRGSDEDVKADTGGVDQGSDHNKSVEIQDSEIKNEIKEDPNEHDGESHSSESDEEVSSSIN